MPANHRLIDGNTEELPDATIIGKHVVCERPRSHLAECPSQPGLDLIRERIEWLSDQHSHTADDAELVHSSSV